ncbi:hypothetical protein U27_01589 [Candidatus Vecturithrix granuli]|uniref:DNA mimic protein DMP19 C-terminal domain-containing protein n=1 Tax=Vecturithrix granuli TaxID=1499967 RepID=A0A081CAT3_VECG1|nr:hypothetical protein U27_01589 [Candidatus Vecturithrix granuli]
MTIEQINMCPQDEELLKLISSEMSLLVPDTPPDDIDQYINTIRALPRLFWAMGAIYELDVSITLDDLGWHFGNHYSLAFADETLRALQEIGAQEEANIFQDTIAIVKTYWTELGEVIASDEGKTFAEWYTSSGLDRELAGLNARMWAITIDQHRSLLDYLPQYARMYPAYAVVPKKSIAMQDNP